MTEKNSKTRLQDDEDVLAYQFLNVVEGAAGEIRFGGSAFIRDGVTWDEVFKAVAQKTAVQFVNCKVIVWRKARTLSPAEAEGFKRF